VIDDLGGALQLAVQRLGDKVLDVVDVLLGDRVARRAGVADVDQGLQVQRVAVQRQRRVEGDVDLLERVGVDVTGAVVPASVQIGCAGSAVFSRLILNWTLTWWAAVSPPLWTRA